MLAGVLIGQLYQSGQAAAAGACGSIAGGAYTPAKLGTDGTNATVLRIAYEVAQLRTANDPDGPRLRLALFEAGVAESGFRNLANTKVPESTALPNDGVGNDHDSVGFVQQRPSASGGDGKPWGSVRQLMDPAYAAGRFLDVAERVAPHVGGSAGALAQAVQSSGHPERYDQAEGRAAALLASQGSAPGAAGDGTATGAVSCGAVDGSLRDPGPGAQGGDHLVPRAENIKNLAVARWGCAAGHAEPCIHDVGGWRPTDNVSQDHPTGHAVDIMVDDDGTAATGDREALGTAIAEFVRANAAGLGVNYIIWDNRIWSAGRAASGWQPYCDAGHCPYGPSPSPTALHEDHVHVSVLWD